MTSQNLQSFLIPQTRDQLSTFLGARHSDWALSINCTLKTHGHVSLKQQIRNQDKSCNFDDEYICWVPNLSCFRFPKFLNLFTCDGFRDLPYLQEPQPQRIYNLILAMGSSAMFTSQLYIILRGKYCRCPIAVMGVVDILEPRLITRNGISTIALAS